MEISIHFIFFFFDGFPKQEEEGVFGGGAEVLAGHCTHYVGVAIEELHELLQAPETTFTATHDGLHHHVVLVILGKLRLHLLKYNSDHSQDGDD